MTLDLAHPPLPSTDRRLDRSVRFDPRSMDYPVTAILDTSRPRAFSWSSYSRTDQGQEGACSGHGVAGELAARPVVVEGVDTAYAFALYQEARARDRAAGHNWSEGATVLAAIQAAQARGFYREYRWAFDIDALAVAVSRHGPAVLGIPWREGMYETDREGGVSWVRAGGRVVGGHCLLDVGYSPRRHAHLLQNSWGPVWGNDGRAWIDEEELAGLLADQGEAVIPVVR